ncbi:MAG: methyltransferase family protein [Candidatus Rokuibacteriota bacterium]
MQSTLSAAGRVLFRWRSYTPLVVIALAVVWLALGGMPMVGPKLLAARFGAGFALAALGQALRFYVMGTVRDGTSGQDYELNASALNTHGPYRLTRNPLYLGNFLIMLGVVLFVGDLFLLGLWAAFFAAQYAAIIAAEEDYLRESFGAVYDAYAQSVPRFWPRLTPAAPPPGGAQATPFDWKRAVKKEHNSAFAWLSAAILAWAMEARAVMPYAAVWAALAMAYVLVKLWKKGKLGGRRG